MNKLQFVEAYKKYFLDDSYYKTIFEMGGKAKGKRRVAQVLKRFYEISNAVFDDQEVWILLIQWSEVGKTIDQLIKGGLQESMSRSCYPGTIDDGVIKVENYESGAFDTAKILYLRYDRFSFTDISSLVHSSATFELGSENSADILCHFISFDIGPVLLNLYDDRGLELLTHDKHLSDFIGTKFVMYT